MPQTPEEIQERYWRAKKRHAVLGECLVMVEALKRRFSSNEASQVPKEGYEKAFYGEAERLEVIREMMLEYRTQMERDYKTLGGAVYR